MLSHERVGSAGRASPEPRDGRRRPSRRALDIAIPLVLGGCWLIVIVTHLPLPYPSDQLNYLNAANAFPHAFPHPDALHQVTRFGLVIPVRLATYAFGTTEAAYHVVPILGTGAVLAGTYALGTLLFSRVVGAAAAAVVITAAPLFQDSAALLPDVTATGLFTVAVALAVAVRKGRLSDRPWALILIGLLMAWSYTVREFIVFAWPLVPILLWRRVRLRGLVWMVAPMLLVGVGELLLCWGLYGSPLARVHAVLTQKPNPNIGYAGRSRLAYLVQLPLAVKKQVGVWLAVLLCAIPLGALAWPRRMAVPVLWCALIWVPLTIEGGLLHPGDPSLRLELVRYWFPLFPALAIGGVAALWMAATWLAARFRTNRLVRALPAVVVVVIAAGAVVSSVGHSWRDPLLTASVNGRAQLGAFRTWMHVHDAAPRTRTVWTDSRSDSVAEMYRRGPFGGIAWHAALRPLEKSGPRPIPGDLVLFFDAGVGDAGPLSDARACTVCRRAAREAWGTPPRPAPTWRPAFATADGVVRVYRVGPAAR
ncbi:MAG TPA: hypothetical protein VGL93_05600 [Streptosporangiaceae bacterium]